MKIKNSADLKQTIAALEIKRRMQENDLVCGTRNLFESLKPANILKSTFEEVASSSELPGKMLSAVIGMGAGILSKKIMVGKSAGILKKIAGTALEYGIANTVVKNSDKIKTGFIFLKKILFHKKEMAAKE